MGLFGFLKKKPHVDSTNTTNPAKTNSSLEKEIKNVADRYIVLESEYTIQSPACPYCNTSLEKMPSKNKNCPLCGGLILVRTSPFAHNKLLLTEKNNEHVESIWKEYRYSVRWIKRLNKNHGVEASAFNKKRIELSAKFGSEPNQPDIIWGIFNDLSIKLARQTPPEYGKLSGIYFDQALFLYEGNKPFFNALQESNRMILMRYQQQGITKVEIPSCDDSCGHCCKQGGKTLTVRQALKEMPIPRKDCTHELEKGKPGWCRCSYMYAK